MTDAKKNNSCMLRKFTYTGGSYKSIASFIRNFQFQTRAVGGDDCSAFNADVRVANGGRRAFLAPYLQNRV